MLSFAHGVSLLRRFWQAYARRWTIEPGFRDTKDLRFGMGLGVLRIADPHRRDRLLLLNAFAIVLLTLLGAAGESLDMDRHLKVNTARRRTHSLFLMMWTACPQRHHSAKAWSQERHKEGGRP